MCHSLNYGLYDTWYNIKIKHFIPNLDEFDFFKEYTDVVYTFLRSQD